MKSRELATLLESPSSSEPTVLLAVGPQAQRTGQSAKEAIELCQAFADRGETVVLADLSLQNPELHKVLGIDNEEGLSDVFLFGASLQHVMRGAPSYAFKLIPASQFTPDSREILEHSWWGHVFEELAQEQTKLVVYLPVNEDGAESLSDRIGTTIILATDNDEFLVKSKLGEDADVLNPQPAPPPPAAVEPQEKPAPAPAPAPARDDEAFEKIRIPKDGARDQLIADLRRRQREALMAPPPALQPLPYEGGAPVSERKAPAPDIRPVEPIFSMAKAEPAPRSHKWVVWALAGVLVLAGAAAAILWQRAKSPAPQAAQSPNRRIAAAPQPAAPAPAGKPLPWSVAIAAYNSIGQAQERVDQLHAVESTIGFYLGPTVVDGNMKYRVMAGPVADSAGAVALRDTLIARRIKTGSTGWDVVSTKYAFLLGDFGNRNDAEVTMRAADNKGIPSYIIEAVAQDGSTQYKLYAGAYAGPGDAEFMRARLKQAGFPDNLVERTGSSRS